MKFVNPSASVHHITSSGNPLSGENPILPSRILGVGAHQDDLEFMCFNAISDGREAGGFSGVILTNGSGSTRNPEHEPLSPEKYSLVRNREQIKAANIGGYRQIIQLNHPSVDVKMANPKEAIQEMFEILTEMRPQIIYTHNPFDKHLSHIATLNVVVKAILEMPLIDRPKQLFGCEVWRGLDWLPSKFKLVWPIDDSGALRDQLTQCFPSQSGRSKNYAQAIKGRRQCNATFLDGYQKDQFQHAEYGIDLGVLIGEKPKSLASFCEEVLEEFQQEIRRGLSF